MAIEWIKTAERLPEDGQVVLASRIGGGHVACVAVRDGADCHFLQLGSVWHGDRCIEPEMWAPVPDYGMQDIRELRKIVAERKEE